MLILAVLQTASIGQLHAATSGPQHPDEFETLMQKIRQDFAANPSIDTALAKYNDKDGSFSGYLSVNVCTMALASGILSSPIPIRRINIIKKRHCMTR